MPHGTMFQVTASAVEGIGVLEVREQIANERENHAKDEFIRDRRKEKNVRHRGTACGMLAFRLSEKVPDRSSSWVKSCTRDSV